MKEIDITGLSKEQVVIRLFNNVYRKSSSSNIIYYTLANQLYLDKDPTKKIPIGTDHAPNEQEVYNLLFEKKNKLDCIGAVKFEIDFSSKQIDVTQYDSIHQTHATSGVKSAAECIAEYRKELKDLVDKEALKADKLAFIRNEFQNKLGITQLQLDIRDSQNGETKVYKSVVKIKDDITISVSSLEYAYKILTGENNEDYLNNIKNQYDKIRAILTKEKEELAAVTEAFATTLGISVECSENNFLHTTSVDWHDGSRSDIRLPNTISQILAIINSNERDKYLADVKKQYDEILEEPKRFAFVENELKEIFGQNLDCWESTKKTLQLKVLINNDHNDPTLSVPNTIKEIYETLRSDQCEVYISSLQKQYNQVYNDFMVAKAKKEADWKLITDTFKNTLGIDVTCEEIPYISIQIQWVNSNGFNKKISLPKTIAEMLNILNSDQREGYLFYVKKECAKIDGRILSPTRTIQSVYGSSGRTTPQQDSNAVIALNKTASI